MILRDAHTVRIWSKMHTHIRMRAKLQILTRETLAYNLPVSADICLDRGELMGWGGEIRRGYAKGLENC